jgi:radical SAM superfamily enzyme YgiQ (UPF0313 family)
MDKKNIYLTQWSTKTPNMPYVYLPYSIGCIWAYASTQKSITNNYQLKELLFLTDEPMKIIDNMDNPSVVGISCYVWNWNYNLEFIRLLKQRWPKCYVVAGGPHIPNNDPDFFIKNKNIDVCIHQEGELVFTDLLNHNSGLKAIEDIPGISYPSIDRSLVKTSGSNRISDLSILPSPYIMGLFDDIVLKYKDRDDIVINAVLETNRGCPYKCTFCDWGGITYSKLKKIDMERVFGEIDWFVKHEFDLILGVDANFGILYERDMAIIEYLVDKKEKTGYPRYFDTCWAKNNSINTLKMAKKLADGDLLKSYIVSIQTTNKLTLEAVERKNMEVSDLGQLMLNANSIGVPLATEVILGLPLESYASWKTGLIELILKNINVRINPLITLPNSEMNDPEYLKRYGIKTNSIETGDSHGIREYNDIVIETNTMSEHNLKKAWAFSWLTIGLELHGFTTYIAKHLHTKWGITYDTFYDGLLKLSSQPNSVLYKHYEYLMHCIGGYQFRLLVSFDGHLNFVKDISMGSRDKFYREINEYIIDITPGASTSELNELVKFQEMALAGYKRSYPLIAKFHYNFVGADEDVPYNCVFDYDVDVKDKTPKGWARHIIGTRLYNGWKTSITKT